MADTMEMSRMPDPIALSTSSPQSHGDDLSTPPRPAPQEQQHQQDTSPSSYSSPRSRNDDDEIQTPPTSPDSSASHHHSDRLVKKVDSRSNAEQVGVHMPDQESKPRISNDQTEVKFSTGQNGSSSHRSPPPNDHIWDDIQPAYFYPMTSNAAPSTHQDQSNGVPVFHPTMEQFADFYKYCQAIDRWGMQTGIVKVVPPKEWSDNLPSIRADDVAKQHSHESNSDHPSSSSSSSSLPSLESVRIKSAIAQHFTPAAKPGLWRQTNITRPAKVWNVKQWSQVCQDMPGPSYDRIQDLTQVRRQMESGEDQIISKDDTNGVRTRSGKTKINTTSNTSGATTNAAPPKKKRKVDVSSSSPSKSEDTAQDVAIDAVASGSNSNGKSALNTPVKKDDKELEHADSDGFKTPPVWTPLSWTPHKVEDLSSDEQDESSSNQHQESPIKNAPRRAQPPKVKTADLTTPAEWAEFDYQRAWLDEWAQGSSSKPDPADWTPEMCREIEGEYWRGLNFGQPPMYGADLKGTLFTPQTKAWNVNSLDNILTRLKLRRKIAGVTDPYLYFGMWRATFAWHVEDMDLYSINYIHFGAPKQWYSIQQKDRMRFETILSSAFPSDARRCSQFMRHKSFLASPSFLAANNIRPLKTVQHAGEFIITYPFGYHSGYNLGFNCAESVNFALESWLDIGRKAKACECEDAQQSVTMDVDALLEESEELELAQKRKEERERKQKGLQEDEAAAQAAAERRRAMARARRAEKKMLMQQQQQSSDKPLKDTDSVGDEDLPELRLLSEVAAGQYDSGEGSANSKLCCLCPSDSTEDIVPIGDCPPGEDEQLYAHTFCANSIPECWVAPVANADGSESEEMEVKGYFNIAKGRWILKCTLCTTPELSKSGCCTPCTFGNCAKAAHPSCAALDGTGWFMDMLPEDEADKLEMRGKYAAKKAGKSKSSKPKAEGEADASEETDAERLVILCRSHNPVERAKEKLRKSLQLRESVKRLSVNDRVQVKYAGGKWETKLLGLRDSVDPAQAGVALISGPPKRTVPWDQVVFSKDITEVSIKSVNEVLDTILKGISVDSEAELTAQLERLMPQVITELDERCKSKLISDDSTWEQLVAIEPEEEEEGDVVVAADEDEQEVGPQNKKRVRRSVHRE